MQMASRTRVETKEVTAKLLLKGNRQIPTPVAVYTLSFCSSAELGACLFASKSLHALVELFLRRTSRLVIAGANDELICFSHALMTSTLRCSSSLQFLDVS